MKFYTGVGSRETPDEMMEVIRQLAYKLARKGFRLRSGAAEGADKAFEAGWWKARMDVIKECPHASHAMSAEIYIAWSGFNGHTATSHAGNVYIPSGAIANEAEAIVSKIHPAWHACSQGARKLHSRNVFQVLGQDLKTPSTMLICWAKTDKAGNVKGGTATAWNLAKQNNIPCFNLNNPVDFARIHKYLEEE